MACQWDAGGHTLAAGGLACLVALGLSTEPGRASGDYGYLEHELACTVGMVSGRMRVGVRY